MSLATLIVASTRTSIASFVLDLARVYSILIFAYIVTTLIFAMGVRVPYSRWTDAILSFLRDVTEPYLRIFRRFIPAVGMFDFSPIIALIVLNVVAQLVANAIHG